MKKYLFIDRDGTLIVEPDDKQIDDVNKLAFLPNVISSLLKLKAAGYTFVMVSNQDGLGTASFPQASFDLPHDLMMNIFSSQGIEFESVHICPHFEKEDCACRKPKLGLVMDYLKQQKMNRAHCYVIGDRDSDLALANNMGIQGIKIGSEGTNDWPEIVTYLLHQNRCASVCRRTNETDIKVSVNLDEADKINIATGIGFFDHMLEQLAKHGGFSLQLSVKGDLHIDEHHTVEDTAIALGDALCQALGDKIGINRYGFVLPMDEALVQVALDLSGRAYFVFDGLFSREQVGGLATELVPHFFRSFASGLKATLNIQAKGENAHHIIEGMFKAVGRALRDAIQKNGSSLPSTKGLL